MSLFCVGLGALVCASFSSPDDTPLKRGVIKKARAQMEYLPLALLIVLYVLAGKLKSFKVQVDFKDDDDGLSLGKRNGRSIHLPPRDEGVKLLERGGRRRRRRK